MEIVEIETPKFEELTEKKYIEIIDRFGNWKVETNKQLKKNEEYILELERKASNYRSKIEDLKEIINDIIERI